MQILKLTDCSFMPETVLLELGALQRLRELAFRFTRTFEGCTGALSAPLAKLRARLPSLQRLQISLDNHGADDIIDIGVARPGWTAMLAALGRMHVKVCLAVCVSLLLACLCATFVRFQPGGRGGRSRIRSRGPCEEQPVGLCMHRCAPVAPDDEA